MIPSRGPAPTVESVQAAVEQLADAFTWWVDLLVGHRVAAPALDPRVVAVALVADLIGDDRDTRQCAVDAVQAVCLGVGVPMGMRVVPDGWWMSPLGQLIERVHYPEL